MFRRSKPISQDGSHTYHCFHATRVQLRLADLDVPLPGEARGWQAAVQEAGERSQNAALHHGDHLLWGSLPLTTIRKEKIVQKLIDSLNNNQLV